MNPTAPKTAKPAVKAPTTPKVVKALTAVPKTPAPPAPAAIVASNKRNRGAVLISKTPAELAALIGDNTPIGVSVKALKNLVLAQRGSDILAKAGL